MNKGVDVSLQYQIWLRCRFVSVFFFLCVCHSYTDSHAFKPQNFILNAQKIWNYFSFKFSLTSVIIIMNLKKKKSSILVGLHFIFSIKCGKSPHPFQEKKKKGETGLSCSLPSEPSEVIAVLFVRHLSCCWVLLKRAWPHLLNSRPLDIYKHW